jgi:hypothetical protein
MKRSKWKDILTEVAQHTKGHDNFFFRGQSNQSWQLMPGLGRSKKSNALYTNIEEALYFDFLNFSGALLPEEPNSWRTIFLMQHHGLPTRLLDWTGSFGIALYFALRNAKADAAVWILDPFDLNQSTMKHHALLGPSDLKYSYEQMFIKKEAKSETSVVALAPPRHHARLFSQGGYFTLHGNLEKGLEDICPSALKKIVIPRRFFSEARDFLRLAGINEFSLFPDLDGLCRHIRKIDLNE